MNKELVFHVLENLEDIIGKEIKIRPYYKSTEVTVDEGDCFKEASEIFDADECKEVFSSVARIAVSILHKNHSEGEELIKELLPLDDLDVDAIMARFKAVLETPEWEQLFIHRNLANGYVLSSITSQVILKPYEKTKLSSSVLMNIKIKNNRDTNNQDIFSLDLSQHDIDKLIHILKTSKHMIKESINQFGGDKNE